MQTLLADDNNEIRAALRLLLEEMGEVDIVEAVDLAGARDVLRAVPLDVVLLDWELPEGSWSGGSSVAFVRDVKHNAPDCRVIAMSGRPEARAESLHNGCDAFVSRNEPPDGLLAQLGLGREARG